MMTQKEINDLYKRIGIGTENERKKFADWDDKNRNSNDEYYFIHCSPFSTLNKEEINA